MELGIYSFGDLDPDGSRGRRTSVHERLTGLVRLASLADEAGLDVIGIGEHHRRDFAVSAPEVVLAAMAHATSRIRLTSAVTVLSTQDPVRVYQQFATLDHLSNGRAEIIAGRGAFTESFPLFGYRLQDYDLLFEEKLDLLLRLRDQTVVSWTGESRPPLLESVIAPRSLQEKLPVWVGVGGTPASAARAGRFGVPMFLGFFTGPEPFVPLVQTYWAAAEAAGQPKSALRVASCGHMFVGRTSQSARDDYYPYYSRYLRMLPQFAAGMPRGVYDQWLAKGLTVGSPAQVVDAIMRHHELLGSTRYLGQIDVGGMPEAMLSESIELFANEVAPVVRKETCGRAEAAAAR